jgi:hypothetical protein
MSANGAFVQSQNGAFIQSQNLARGGEGAPAVTPGPPRGGKIWWANDVSGNASGSWRPLSMDVYGPGPVTGLPAPGSGWGENWGGYQDFAISVLGDGVDPYVFLADSSNLVRLDGNGFYVWLQTRSTLPIATNSTLLAVERNPTGKTWFTAWFDATDQASVILKHDVDTGDATIVHNYPSISNREPRILGLCRVGEYLLSLVGYPLTDVFTPPVENELRLDRFDRISVGSPITAILREDLVDSVTPYSNSALGNGYNTQVAGDNHQRVNITQAFMAETPLHRIWNISPFSEATNDAGNLNNAPGTTPYETSFQNNAIYSSGGGLLPLPSNDVASGVRYYQRSGNTIHAFVGTPNLREWSYLMGFQNIGLHIETALIESLVFDWFPKEDAKDTPDLSGLSSRPVNDNAPVTFTFTSDLAAGTLYPYYDSLGDLQNLDGDVPADDDIPRWNHLAGSGYPLGLLTERAASDFISNSNGTGINYPWFVGAYGVLYVDIWYSAADDGLFNPAFFRMSGPSAFLLQIDRVAKNGDPSYFSAGFNTNIVRRLDRVQIVNAEAGAGRFRLAIGWRDETNFTDPSGATSWADLYCGQWSDAEGNLGVNLGNGPGEGVLIGSLTADHDSRGVVADGLSTGTGGAARSVEVNTARVQYYDANLERSEMAAFLRDLTSGRDPVG